MNGTHQDPSIFAINQNGATCLERAIFFVNRHWMLVVSGVLGLYSGLPFLAPVFMELGWETPAKAIYFIYSFLCHQLPQRSFFLFGSKFTYSLPEIQSMWQYTQDPLILRQFIGNPDVGWKVAWSDRMVAMFTSLWVFGMLWKPLLHWLKPIRLKGLILALLPMAVDGASHFISDLSGIGSGFRDSNAWLAFVTNSTLPTGFYGGDAWGSFNSLMRLLTGVLFGLGVIWYVFPYLEDAFSQHA